MSHENYLVNNSKNGPTVILIRLMPQFQEWRWLCEYCMKLDPICLILKLSVLKTNSFHLTPKKWNTTKMKQSVLYDRLDRLKFLLTFSSWVHQQSYLTVFKMEYSILKTLLIYSIHNNRLIRDRSALWNAVLKLLRVTFLSSYVLNIISFLINDRRVCRFEYWWYEDSYLQPYLYYALVSVWYRRLSYSIYSEQSWLSFIFQTV